MCELTSGKDKLCRKWIGGMVGAVIGQLEDVQSITIAAGVVTAMTMKSGKRAYFFKVQHETSNYGEVMNSNRQNGTNVCTQTLSLMHQDYETATRNSGMELVQGEYFVIPYYNNGKTKLAGVSVDVDGAFDVDLSGGLMSVTQTHNSGTAKEDKNGDDWVFEGKENIKALTIAKSIAESLLDVAS